MCAKKSIAIMVCIFLSVPSLFSDVPLPQVHKPGIPYLFESMNFQTLQMHIFPPQISGMVTDPYSDLHWNPAYILRQSKKSFYIDFLAPTSTDPLPAYTPYPNNYDDTDAYIVAPRWYSQTSISGVQTTPHYTFAMLVPLNSKITVGFINRSLFDYGPFRTTTWWTEGYREEAFADIPAAAELEPKRLEVDENQQTVVGTQSELVLGYKVTQRVEVGVRFGHYIFNRDGDLNDSKWATYPHSSFADLNDESLKIDGHHVETGLGLLYHFSDKTRLGFYGGFIRGEGTEETASLDTSDSWYERDTNTAYYNKHRYVLASRDAYTSRGKKPLIAVTFEKKISSKWIFRSFLYGSWSDADISGSVASEDTTFGDQTYDYWDNSTKHFRRYEYDSGRESGLSGTGKERTNHLKGFASLIYAPQGNWSLFGGIQIQRYTSEKETGEASDYTYNWYREYTVYKPETYRYHYTHDKTYSYKAHRKDWSVFLPVGLKIQVVKGLHLILGMDVTFTLTDQDSEGKLLYPRKITRKWENETLVVEDEEMDRYEEYSSHPAKNFDRAVGYRFGITYKHPVGATLYVRCQEDIFDATNWAFGFEMNW